MQQKEALELLKMGKNVFLTGPAGSGKTHVLNTYIAYLRKKNISVAVTASTGIAATHMDGTTIHSWTGIGIKSALGRKAFAHLRKQKELAERIRATRVLIIDEISMLDADRFSLIDEVCQLFRESYQPFGGLQIIVSGDFFQLPPIPKQNEPTPAFCFESKSWEYADFTVCYLESQYRQTEPELLSILEAIRAGTVSPDTVTLLKTRIQRQKTADHITRLFTHNAAVDTMNTSRLSEIPGDAYRYRMAADGPDELVHELKKSCLAPEELILKIGAAVMCTKNNHEAGYVNGTLGTVIAFDETNRFPTIRTIHGRTIGLRPTTWELKEDHGEVLAEITQIPLRLAWAITIHKSQGMSLDAAEIDLRHAFTEGMGYVALSRVRSLSGMYLAGLNDIALRVNEKVRHFDTTLKHTSNEHLAFLLSMKKTDVTAEKRAFVASK